MNCHDVHRVPYIRAISTMKADYLILTLSTVGINLDLLVLRQISAASWAHVAWEGLYFLLEYTFIFFVDLYTVCL